MEKLPPPLKPKRRAYISSRLPERFTNIYFHKETAVFAHDFSLVVLWRRFSSVLHTLFIAIVIKLNE